MTEIDNINKYEIYVDAQFVEPGCWEFFHSDGNKYGFPELDFHVPVFLTRTYEIYEYVQIDKESEIIPIQRQEFNPFFIEFGFFDTINRNKVNSSNQLTSDMIDFIKSRRSDVFYLSDNDLKKWFDEIGINELPWNKGTSLETTINDIDEVSYIPSHIVSKAKYFNIDVNK